MNLKPLGIVDKTIFILGLILGGVVAFVLLAGVVAALLALWLGGSHRPVSIHPANGPDGAVPDLQPPDEHGRLPESGGER